MVLIEGVILIKTMEKLYLKFILSISFLYLHKLLQRKYYKVEFALIRFCISVCFITLITSGDATGQVEQINMLAPQVSSVIKYGNTDISAYTGQSGYSIPLLNVKTKDITIPISLGYNSEGFKPNSNTGPCGINWYLKAEGLITRKVNGDPDDRVETCSPYVNNGFYAATKNHTSSSDNQIFNFSATMNQFCGTYINPGYEYLPDEFSYSCLGHTGKFYITYGGGAKVVANEDVKVDLSNFSLQNHYSAHPSPSTIVLTMADGYKFTFGGEIKNLDYNYGEVVNAIPDSTYQTSIIVGWHLTKVLSPEGKQVVYTYKNHNGGLDHLTINGLDAIFYTLNRYFNSEASVQLATQYWGTEYIGSTSTNSAHKTYVDNLSKIAVLERIESEDFMIYFQYSNKATAFYRKNGGNSDHTSYYSGGGQLDRITLFNKTDDIEIKRFQFSYADLGGSYGTRHFLTSLTESGKGTYNFNYYRTSIIPSAYTRNIDHWGYWKGGYDENAEVIPEVSQDANGNQIISSSLRDPDTSYCNVALLQKVTYPTGGTTTFVYEPHQYARRLERKSDHAFFPYGYNVTGYAGGARIKSIKDSASATSVTTRTFKYINSYINNGTSSSGYLLDWPRYIYLWNTNYPLPAVQYYNLKMRGSSYHSNYNTEENYINYAEITEETAGNGYKVVKFSNYDSNPDYSDYSEHDWEPTTTVYIDNLPLFKSCAGFQYNDRSNERGNIIFTGYYKADKTPVKSSSYTYTPFDPGADYIVSLLPSTTFSQAYKTYVRPCRLIADTSSTNASTIIKEVSTYTYDANLHNLKLASSTGSNGKTKTKAFTYANDYANGTTFIDHMKSAYLVSLPIEQVAYQTDGSNTNILSGKVTQYYTGAKGRPQTIYEMQSSAPVPLASFKFSSRTTGVLPTIGTPQTFSIDSRYQPELNFTQYDSYGNPTEFSRNSGPSNSMIWGYNGQYPVAEVSNAKASEVYFQNFEDWNADYDGNLQKVELPGHTGIALGIIGNTSSSEKYSHSSRPITIVPGTARKFTYSGWVRSNGPSAEIFLFMYRPGETGYYSYFDNVGTGNIATGDLNKWIYLKKEFLVPADVSTLSLRLDNNGTGAVHFDDLLVYPSDSQIKTFTYRPQVGFSSEIDVKGMPLIFEYDQFNRPAFTRDRNLNIINSRSYHYKN